MKEDIMTMDIDRKSLLASYVLMVIMFLLTYKRLFGGRL